MCHVFVLIRNDLVYLSRTISELRAGSFRSALETADSNESGSTIFILEIEFKVFTHIVYIKDVLHVKENIPYTYQSQYKQRASIIYSWMSRSWYVQRL